VRTQGKYQRRRSVHETSSVWGVSQRTESVCLLRAVCETRERGVGLHGPTLALTPSRLCGALSTYVHPVHESRMSARTFFGHTPRALPASASAAPTSASAMRTATAAHNVSDHRIIATHMIDCACEQRLVSTRHQPARPLTSECLPRRRTCRWSANSLVSDDTHAYERLPPHVQLCE